MAWFQKNEKFDKLILDNFESTLIECSEGKLDEWKKDAKGMLALIILNDQFPRNIYRNSPKMFSYDKLARQLAVEAIQSGFEKEYTVFQRSFVYLPFEHSEDKDDQKKCLELFEQLHKEYPEVGWSKMCIQYALAHKKIIDQFGRFPHRNATLQRETTKEEEEFLKTEGSSF